MQSESCSAWSSCEKGTAKGKGKDLLLQGREAEGEQRQGQTQQGNLLTDAAYFAWRIAQSKPDRERKADRVVEAKHEVCRRTKQSTTSPKQRTTTTRAKHDVVEARRQAKHDVSHAHAYLLLNCKLLAKSFFPFAPPLGGALGGGGAPAPAYLCAWRPTYAASCRRDCP